MADNSAVKVVLLRSFLEGPSEREGLQRVAVVYLEDKQYLITSPRGHSD